jgi:hypothetical protein
LQLDEFGMQLGQLTLVILAFQLAIRRRLIRVAILVGLVLFFFSGHAHSPIV